jgi:hypothetical protein
MRSLHGDETLRPSGCADSTLQLPLLPKRSVLTTSTSATSNSMEIAAAAARAAAMAVQAPFEAVRTHLISSPLYTRVCGRTNSCTG